MARGYNVWVELEGGKALEQQLLAIGAAAAGESLDQAAFAGAEIMRANIEPRVPRKRGILVKDLRVKSMDAEKSETHAVFGIGWFSRTVAWLVEFGHMLVKGGKLGSGGHVVGHVPAHPFLRPGFDESGEDAVTAVGTVLRENIEAAAAANGPVGP